MTDEKKTAMLERVRKLLAKASAEGVTEAEAQALTAKATELMARYNIDRAVAEKRAGTRVTPIRKIIPLDKPWDKLKSTMIFVIAEALGCQSIRIEEYARRGVRKFHTEVFGFEADVELLDLLYTSLWLQLTNELLHAKAPAYLSGRDKMAWNRSFIIGYIGGVKPVLEAAYARAVAEAEASGTGAELVLASRALQVQEAYQNIHPDARKTRISYTGTGHSQGHAAGQRANVHSRAGVGSSGRALTR